VILLELSELFAPLQFPDCMRIIGPVHNSVALKRTACPSSAILHHDLPMNSGASLIPRRCSTQIVKNTPEYARHLHLRFEQAPPKSSG
jgi:hypothetical protein